MRFYQHRRFVRGPAATGKRRKAGFNPLATFRGATRPQKLLIGLGSVSFVAGMALLAFGLLAAFSSGSQAAPKGPPVVQVVVTPTPKPTAKPVTATPVPTPVPAPPLGDSPYQMIISKIGVDAPVEAYGLDENQVPEVPTGPGQGPGQIVAWYNFSAKPGTGSNAVFAGHVTWNGAAVFYRLTSVAAGDEVHLVGQDGTNLTYRVAKVFSVNPNDPNARTVMAGTPTDTLTIITCDGTYSANGDPVFGGEYDQRLVVQADLMSVTPGAAVAAAGG